MVEWFSGFQEGAGNGVMRAFAGLLLVLVYRAIYGLSEQAQSESSDPISTTSWMIVGVLGVAAAVGFSAQGDYDCSEYDGYKTGCEMTEVYPTTRAQQWQGFVSSGLFLLVAAGAGAVSGAEMRRKRPDSRAPYADTSENVSRGVLRQIFVWGALCGLAAGLFFFSALTSAWTGERWGGAAGITVFVLEFLTYGLITLLSQDHISSLQDSLRRWVTGDPVTATAEGRSVHLGSP